MPPLIDSHEDLAWNILTFGRDYTRSVIETRQLERNTQAVKENGDVLLGWPEWRQGQVAVVFSTLHAAPARRVEFAWESQIYPDGDYENAHRLYRNQLGVYHRLVETHPDKFCLIRTTDELDQVWEHWQGPSFPDAECPLGMVLMIEGADGVRTPDEVSEWWDLGVRIICPAWAGTRYCGGTLEPGPLTKDGVALLDAMDACGFILDLSHMDEAAALQALEIYAGVVVATHANAAALLKGNESNRHLSDRVLSGLIERGGVIGVVPYNMFLESGWKTSDPRTGITLKHVSNQIDYICQIAGDAFHVGIGSDFDGGFGLQAVPEDVDSIADLQKITPLLEDQGYSNYDLEAIFNQNWRNILNKSLPNS
ncbi:MAG: membrane dipeptidase [Anaerolineales bacterium]|nr:membrane dipeptidase [Anaerolineales bacterium]